MYPAAVALLVLDRLQHLDVSCGMHAVKILRAAPLDECAYHWYRIAAVACTDPGGPGYPVTPC